MKLATCFVILGACLLHQESASKNWWDVDSDDSVELDSKEVDSDDSVELDFEEIDPDNSAEPISREVDRDDSKKLDRRKMNLDDSTITTTPRRTSTVSPMPPVPTNCPCITTSEYNPICGENKITYDNQGMLECARRCGPAVRVLFYGRCGQLVPQ